jgi:gliding motility-associated transport system ATP-binding protein
VIAIVADRLSRWYGARRAVDDVSFEVMGGEVMGLLGPNGSGKTTILRILTGFLRPSSGTARVAGVDIVDDPLEARRRIGYVPEDVPLYEWMRVREFLEFMARIKQAPAGKARAADRVIEQLRLRDVERVPIGKLSRGFRQRVAIAQALVNDPPVLVLDEPTNGLDPRQIAEMRALIRSLAGGHTVLITSHVLAEVERVADRAAILLAGRLLAVHPLHQGAPGTRIRLVARGPLHTVRACLEQVGSVKSVAVEPRASPDPDVVVCTLVVEAPGVAETLAGHLSARGISLLELGEERPDLESVFLALTGAGDGAGA